MMHTRHRTSASVDGESLQADVMRFMAIIAFCLVAIMALVRDVQPPSAEQQVVHRSLEVPIEAPIDVPIEKQTTKPVSKAVTKAVAEPEMQPKPTPPVSKVSPPQEKPVLANVEPAEPLLNRLNTALVEAKQVPDVAPISAAQPESTEPEGLTLRFGTDRDFLRLIAKGDVGVYLFRDQQAYRLTKAYGFGPAQPPHQLYELMPSTIPGAIRAAAESSSHELSGYRWGVAMPERIASRIERLVAVERSGELIINRFGEVVHRASSELARAGG